MARILDIQKKSNAWMANFEANVVRLIEADGQKTVDVNRTQFFNSINSEDMPLINKLTLDENLSPAYAKRTGKKKPNFWLTGDFKKGMFLFMPSMKEYFIASKGSVSGYLANNYRRIFGISPANQPKVQAINNALVINDYMKVFQ